MLAIGSTGRAVAFLQARLGVLASGTFDQVTDAALRAWQASHGLTVDGKYGPVTNRALTAYTPLQLATAAKSAGLDHAAFQAVIEVETAGAGFLDDGRPKILLERHYVYRLATQAERDKLPADLCYPSAGNYGAGGANQWDRFERVAQVNEALAIQSVSWGIGQVMGANYAKAGCTSPRAMMLDAARDEGRQLVQMATFIAGMQGLRDALNAHDWKAFARGYNGPGFDGYDTKLAAAFKALSAP